MTTIKQAKTILAPANVTLRKRDGEFRVNFKGGTEASVYYTNDIDDAIATGLHMSQARVDLTESQIQI